MKNNVYIGNRYVPIFADPVEWDNLRQYEPLTIVTYQGTAYTSRKTVPVGTALSNTEYWVVTGNYNAQVEEYRQEVVDLGNNLNALTARVDTAEANINDLNDTVYGDDIILIGDSYGVDSSAGGHSWASQVQGVYPGAYRSTIGGTGFSSDEYLPNNYLSMLQGLNVAHPERVRIILVLGGANDGNLYHLGRVTLATIKARIEAFMTYAKTAFPNAKVVTAFVGWYRSNDRFGAYNAVKHLYRDTTNKFSNGEYNGNGDTIMHNNANINTSDSIHPTQIASDEIACFAFSCINGGSYKYFSEVECTITPATNIQSIAQYFRMFCQYNGDICTITNVGQKGQFSYDRIDLVNEVSRSDGEPIIIELGDISGTPVGGRNPLLYQVDLITSNAANAIVRGITGHFTIQGNKLYITAHNPYPSGTTYAIKVLLFFNASGCCALEFN